MARAKSSGETQCVPNEKNQNQNNGNAKAKIGGDPKTLEKNHRKLSEAGAENK